MVFSAWHAMAQSDTFWAFLLWAGAAVLLAGPAWSRAKHELTPSDLEREAAALRQAAWPDLLEAIQRDGATSGGSDGERRHWIVGEALRRLHLATGPDPLVSAASLVSDARLREVRGREAQQRANRGEFALGLSWDEAGQPLAAALVIPGRIAAGTPLGQDNPMMLGSERGHWLPRQAALLFGQAGRVRFFVLTGPEPAP